MDLYSVQEISYKCTRFHPGQYDQRKVLLMPGYHIRFQYEENLKLNTIREFYFLRKNAVKKKKKICAALKSKLL